MSERNRKEQREARARAKETGESYTVALRHVRKQTEQSPAPESTTPEDTWARGFGGGL